ncbi:metal-dependent hydrolase [Candidatus Riesia pediculischaeffi]|uniref:Membrane-bound metal-dependent hydrolase YdjM, induced during SOS response n=1 Tax=Candidatus Riesia pediculischaeffi PTSU TaxID=1401651 RepID=A0A0C1V6C7_9ENTR|nr:metal-dependent hydrolase [Candidatus Riesia pediculischaeffi]KIE63994.1 Membrane-bound metal-dependent hydrolase YdjM, induced during SOS response [Candidatus Riesia pediculischaeffi PTSU]
MTFVGHIWFSISLLFFSKTILNDYNLFDGDFIHLISGSIIGSMIPDVDHPCSRIGRLMRCISLPIYKLSGHRGITHSLLFLIIIILSLNPVLERSIVSYDFTKSFFLGYFSHIIGDIFTKNGVPLFWPFKTKISLPILKNDNIYRVERTISIILIMLSILIPKNYFTYIILFAESMKKFFFRTQSMLEILS